MEYYMDAARSEVFFANMVVLVEGETEKLMLPRWAEYFFADKGILEKLVTTTFIDMIGKFNAQIYQKLLNGFKIPYVIIIDDDKDSGDPSMASLNHHIKKLAESGTGQYFTLSGDFEKEFKISGHKYDKHYKKKHKPFVAFRHFFEGTGAPKKEVLEILRTNTKLQAIFQAIYGQKP